MPSGPITRPCTSKELRFLRKRRDSIRLRQAPWWQSVVTFLVVFGTLALVTLWADGKNPRFIIGFWGVLGALIAIPSFIDARLRRRREIAAYDAAIAASQAEELTVVARRFWEFEEEEDEGASYAFELLTGGVVFISGQDFDASARFPCLDFSIVQFRNARGGVLDMVIEKRSAKARPERLIAAKDKAGLAIPEHGSFREGTLEEVYQQLLPD